MIPLTLPPLTFFQYSPLIPNMSNTHNTSVLKAQHRKTNFDFKFVMSTWCLSQRTISSKIPKTAHWCFFLHCLINNLRNSKNKNISDTIFQHNVETHLELISNLISCETSHNDSSVYYKYLSSLFKHTNYAVCTERSTSIWFGLNFSIFHYTNIKHLVHFADLFKNHTICQ